MKRMEKEKNPEQKHQEIKLKRKIKGTEKSMKKLNKKRERRRGVK